MKTHPPKLLVLFPMYEPRNYRHHLVAIDDALVVHRSSPIEYQLELRPMVKLSAKGQNSYGQSLLRLAADLEAGYIVVVVDRDQFLSDLESLARRHVAPKDLDAIERAAQVVGERTTFQIKEHDDTDNAQYEINRRLVASRRRRTKADPHEREGLSCIAGIPTPRAEQLWNAMRHELTDVRSNQAGKAAWQRWAGRNRPDMPREAG